MVLREDATRLARLASELSSVSHRPQMQRHTYVGARWWNVTVDENAWLAERFAQHRGRLRAMAYRMLGSATEADDALQIAWLRLSAADAGRIENMAGWLTTVVGRVCVDLLRLRKARREESLGTLMNSGRGQLSGQKAL
jgi:hypothetical protein